MTFEEVLDTLKIPYRTSGHHHCRDGWVQLDCPFCGKGSEKFHLGYNIRSHYMNCWKCGPHSVKSTLFRASRASKEEIGRLLGSLDQSGVLAEDELVLTGRLRLPRGLEPLGAAHRRNLTNRGFDPDEIERLWRVQGLGRTAELPWRIFIPIHFKGKVVSWTTRSLGNKQRYMSASREDEDIDHKHLLYGQDYCSHSIIIVEGPTDVWNVGPGAVATFGLSFTSHQVKRMGLHPFRYVCFDSTKDAQSRAVQLADLLSVFPGETHIVELDAEDPGSASKKEIKLLRKYAKL